MSAISLLIPSTRFRTVIGVLQLDAAVSIQHDANATPTKNPIEARSGDSDDNFTDHIRLQNRTLSIEALISESPLSIFSSAFNIFTGAAATSVANDLVGPTSNVAAQAFATGLGSIAGLIANRQEGDLSFPKKAFDYLISDLRDKRFPFTIVTRLQTYENMVITSLSVPQTAADGRSLRFSATFEQIKIVNTKTVAIPEGIVRNSGATQTQQQGKQTADTATDENGSKAKAFFDNIGVTTRGSGIIN